MRTNFITQQGWVGFCFPKTYRKSTNSIARDYFFSGDPRKFSPCHQTQQQVFNLQVPPLANPPSWTPALSRASAAAWALGPHLKERQKHRTNGFAQRFAKPRSCVANRCAPYLSFSGMQQTHTGAARSWAVPGPWQHCRSSCHSLCDSAVAEATAVLWGVFPCCFGSQQPLLEWIHLSVFLVTALGRACSSICWPRRIFSIIFWKLGKLCCDVFGRIV